MIRRPTSWPLWAQLALTLSLATVLVVVVTGEKVRQWETDYLVRVLEKQSQKTVGVLGAASVDAIITEDRPLLDTVVSRAAAKDREILQLEILDTEGKRLARWQRPDSEVIDHLSIRQPVVIEGDLYGHIIISWDTSAMNSQIRFHVDRMRWLSGVAMASLSVFLVLLLNLLAFRPMRQLEKALPSEVSLADARGVLVSARRSCELSLLSDAIEALKERQAELEHARDSLTEARDDALAASKAKSEFLAVMSHELRTPIHGILGSLDLARDTPMTDEQVNLLETAYLSGESLLGVINNILDYSKIEADRLELEDVRFDPRELVENVASMLASVAAEKHLELSCFVDFQTPARVRGDPVRLRQILTNLVGNALKFTRKGEVKVRLSVAECSGQECLLRFTVEDTGIGIPADHMGNLFDAFAQADSSTTRRFGGSGLGLAIVRRLAEAMGGRAEVASEVGKGSCFTVTARFGVEVAVDSDRPERSMPAIPILVVDDNQTNLGILKHYLSNWGMHPVLASSPSQALTLAREAAQQGDPFSAALIDWFMPEMDGAELATLLRQQDFGRRMKLVLLSSTGFPREQADAVGFALTLTKPIRQSMLFDALREVLGEDRRVPQPEKQGAAKPLEPLNGSVLLVEDNAVNRKIAVKMMRKMGVEPEVAVDGREALERVTGDGQPPDLVLMDIQMPELDGFQATGAIRAWESENGREPTRIIAMTANAMQGDRERCIEAGMDDYLAKPVQREALYAVMRKWLS